MSTKETIQAAVHALEKSRGKLSIGEAARRYKVPYTTLHDHFSSRDTRIGAGRPTLLTADEETEIVYYCQVLQEIGFGMTREVVSEIVMDYITMRRPNPFNQRPGDKWWSGFLKRHPQLMQRKPQHLSKHRAIAGSHATIDAFFSKVRSQAV